MKHPSRGMRNFMRNIYHYFSSKSIFVLGSLLFLPGCLAITENGPRLYSGQHQSIFAPPTVGGAAAIPLWTYPDPAARGKVDLWHNWRNPGFGQVNIQSACAYGGCKFWR